MHPLLPVLLEAAAGRFPPDDGAVMVLPPLAPGLEAVVSLPARAYVYTALPKDEALKIVSDAYGGATDPGTRLALGRGGEPELPVRQDLDDHPRVRHAKAVRCDVVVRSDERGLVTLATGAAGRRELSGQAPRPGQATGARPPATRSTARPARSSRPGRRATPGRCARSSPSALRRTAARCSSTSRRRSASGSRAGVW